MFRSLFPLLLLAAGLGAQDHTTWRDYGGASDSAQYSALTQINRSNVEQLKVAWTYPTGDGSKYFFNPLVVDGTMYVLAKNNSIVALDAATGKEIWTYAHDAGTSRHHQPRHQLLGEQGPAATGGCSSRATTSCGPSTRRPGRPITSFGENGARRSEGRARARSRRRSAGAVHHARDACSKTC